MFCRPRLSAITLPTRGLLFMHYALRNTQHAVRIAWCVFRPWRLNGDKRPERSPRQLGISRSNSFVVVWRSAQARNDQLPPPASRTRWIVRRAHLRTSARLGVRVRQVQKNPLQGNGVRQMWCRSRARARPPRTDGAHRTCHASRARLVHAARPHLHRFAARRHAPQFGSRVVLRST